MDQTLTNSAPAQLPPLHDHPFYAEGMAYIKAGRWQPALEAFQLLKEFYPENPEVKDVLNEVQMRATMTGVQFKPSTNRTKGRMVRRVVVTGLLLLVIAIAGYLIYEIWISPTVIYELRLRQTAQLRNEADEALAAGDYARARQTLAELQAILPEDPETIAALRKVERAEKLAGLYSEAKTLMSAGEWDQAIERLTELQSLDEQYRDLPQLLQIAHESQALDQQFEAAEAALANKEWEAAISAYQSLQQTNLTFKFEEIQTGLFKSHLQYGQALMETAETDLEQVSKALSHFSEALQLRPLDPETLDERHLAETYLAALNATDQNEKIELLQQIYDKRPDYAGQVLSQQLYLLLVARADGLLQANEEAAALADYQRASQLSVEDTSEAHQKLTELAAETSQ
jgi:tetratricopeptide (TPR) repeat protein